jgi:hypothetical protein
LIFSEKGKSQSIKTNGEEEEEEEMMMSTKNYYSSIQNALKQL